MPLAKPPDSTPLDFYRWRLVRNYFFHDQTQYLSHMRKRREQPIAAVRPGTLEKVWKIQSPELGLKG